MKQHEADRLATNLIAKYGLEVKAAVKTNGNQQIVLLEPVDVHANEGFSVSIIVGWRSLSYELNFGKFAADLLRQMASSSEEKKLIFSEISQECIREKGVVQLVINGVSIDPTDPTAWPDKWATMSLSMRRSSLEINTDDHRLTEHLTNVWTERFYGLIIALSPLEEIEDENKSSMPEGTVVRVAVNRYERSRFNRTVCINFHGTACKVCGVNLGQKYGSIGSGFIHVHHVTPVSKIGTGYMVNPIKDLIPVCPNCHAMLHRRNPPYSVSDLQQFMKEAEFVDDECT